MHYELTADLQRILDDDFTLLQQQIETIKLEKLHNDLKTISERLEKSPSMHKILSLPFFSGPNASIGIFLNKPIPLSYILFSLDAEIVKPVIDSTLRILKAYQTKILSIETDDLLQEVNHLSINFYFK